MKGSKRLAEFYSKEAKKLILSKKANKQVAAKLERFPVHQGKAKRLSCCSGALIENVNDQTGEVNIASYWLCRIRSCPNCQRLQTRKLFAVYLSEINKYLSCHPTSGIVGLGLSIPNCHITHLRKNLTAMSKVWGKIAQRNAFKRKIPGWIRTVEVTFHDDGMVHPHYDFLLLVAPSYFGYGYIKEENWKISWQEALKVNWTPKIYMKNYKPHPNLETDIRKELGYILKHMKMIDIDSDMLNNFIE